MLNYVEYASRKWENPLQENNFGQLPPVQHGQKKDPESKAPGLSCLMAGLGERSRTSPEMDEETCPANSERRNSGRQYLCGLISKHMNPKGLGSPALPLRSLHLSAHRGGVHTDKADTAPCFQKVHSTNQVLNAAGVPHVCLIILLANSAA